jgi:hypothetical protein
MQQAQQTAPIEARRTGRGRERAKIRGICLSARVSEVAETRSRRR